MQPPRIYNSYSNMYAQYPNRNNNRMRDQMKGEHTIKVRGNGEVEVRPNQAVLSLGIKTEDKEVQAAQQQNATLANQFIMSITNLGVDTKDIETVSYTIEPRYDYIEGEQILRGYVVTHLFRVIVKDVTKVGEVIDVSTKNGVNVVNNISFEVSDVSPYYGEALQRATLNAKQHAEQIAKAIGVSLNLIPVWVVEGEIQSERPFYPMPMMASSSVPTSPPIQEGKVKVKATVQALYQFTSF
ncbi:SIMPL domain-containing protein [Mesobacillus maritimus]|uniref:SIMPL domain-containing protein n=1 Tax=Mesobacillus maritimus TaxID=1643336 RepID=UPI0020409B19|nr:SIMPL domain-containing protein [Mesobacillus maritimus]MCM3587431.1 SIMPL domain-containing protein [Mesobacillus maritimus]MCM3672189.1 SIMPL domain-containing protein [Mesobacillus maritimus]